MIKKPTTLMKRFAPLAALFLVACASTDYRYDDDYYYSDSYYGTADGYDPYYGYGSDYSSAGGGVYYNNYNYYPDRWGISYSSVYYSPYRYPRVGFYYSSSRCGYGWYYDCYPGYGFYYNSWPSYGFGWGLGLSYSRYSYRYYDNYWWYNHWRNRSYDPYRYRSRYNSTYPTNRGYYSARNEARRLTDRQRSSQYKGQHNSGRYNNTRETVPSRRPVNRQRSSGSRYQNVSPRYKGNSRSNQSSQLPSRSRSSSIRGSHNDSRQNSQNLRTNYQKPMATSERSTDTAASQLIRQRYQNNLNQRKEANRQNKPVASSLRGANRTTVTNTRQIPARSLYNSNQRQQTERRQAINQQDSRQAQADRFQQPGTTRNMTPSNHNRPQRVTQPRVMPTRPVVNQPPRQSTPPPVTQRTKPVTRANTKPKTTAPKVRAHRSERRSSSRQRDPN